MFTLEPGQGPAGGGLVGPGPATGFPFIPVRGATGPRAPHTYGRGRGVPNGNQGRRLFCKLLWNGEINCADKASSGLSFLHLTANQCNMLEKLGGLDPFL